MKPETQRWVRLAEEDRQVARTALESSLHRPCVFHCQQALEKVLKAMWIEQREQGYPPKKHNLVSLAQELGLQLEDEMWEFLDDLAKQYNPTRYGDVIAEYSRDQGVHYYRRTEELLDWLLAKLK